MLIQRKLLGPVLEALVDSALVLVEGPPGCGKTIFAGQVGVASLGGGLVLDGGLPSSRPFLLDPQLAKPKGRVLIVDRADADPAYLPALASFLGSGLGRGTRVLLIGTSFPKEGHGPRPIPRFELRPLGYGELGVELKEKLWLRGGYPQALLAETDALAFSWLKAHLDRLVEGRLALAGLSGPPARARALLALLAQGQAGAFNESLAARSLGISRPTVERALFALEELGLLARLAALPPRPGRPSIAAPALYLRDPGLLHALLGLDSGRSLASSPQREASWRGHVLEVCRANLAPGVEAFRCMTKDGAGLDLVLQKEGRTWLALATRTSPPGPRSLRWAGELARELGAEQRVLVVPKARGGEEGEVPGWSLLSLEGFLERLKGGG